MSTRERASHRFGHFEHSPICRSDSHGDIPAVTDLSLIERLLVGYGTLVPNHPRKWWLHPKLRKWLGIRVDRELEVVREGLRWSLNPADFPQESLFWLGTKDTWDLFHLRQYVVPGGVVLDVGSNFGHYALNLAAAMNRIGEVHALEPDPDNFEHLRRHIAWNGLEEVVQARCLGVSDRPETVAMKRHPGNSGHTAIAPQGEIGGITLTTLDAYCKGAGLDRLDVIVLDVEGYEERALRGAEKTLSQFKPIVLVELFEPVMEQQGSSPEAAARLLTDHGYQLFAAHKDRLEPLTVMPTGDLGRNAFAFHRDKPPGRARVQD
jgi:FkbM family methyltransferase